MSNRTIYLIYILNPNVLSKYNITSLCTITKVNFQIHIEYCLKIQKPGREKQRKMKLVQCIETYFMWNKNIHGQCLIIFIWQYDLVIMTIHDMGWIYVFFESVVGFSAFSIPLHLRYIKFPNSKEAGTRWTKMQIFSLTIFLCFSMKFIWHICRNISK